MDNLKKLVGEDVFKTHIEPKLGTDKKYFFGEGEFIPKGRFDEINNQSKDYKTQLAERDKQLEELKKSSSGNEELTKKLNELTELNKKQKDEYEGKLAQQEYNFEFNKVISGANAKDPKVLEALIDKTKVVYKDGKLTGLQEQIGEKRKSHEWVFNTNPTPGNIGNPMHKGGQSNSSNNQTTNPQTGQKSWNKVNRDQRI